MEARGSLFDGVFLRTFEKTNGTVLQPLQRGLHQGKFRDEKLKHRNLGRVFRRPCGSYCVLMIENQVCRFPQP
jgi:hypothetical protein